MKPARTRASLAVFSVLAAVPLIAGIVASCGGPRREAGKARYAAAVKQEFLHAWDNYRRYAWGHDELKPLSRSPHDWYSGTLLMTPVDSYDSLLLLGLKEQAAEAKSLIKERLSFDQDILVSNFEVTIRLLGGLLASYELDGDEMFLSKAVELADRLLPAFASPTGMPYRFVNLRTGRTDGKVSNPAEIGTLSLEFGTLSRHTGNPVYRDAAFKAVAALSSRLSPIGLPGSAIDVETGEWVNRRSHISGGIDSYYEYLLKASILFEDEESGRVFRRAVSAANARLADERGGELWYGVADMDSGGVQRTLFGSLDAFFPAVLALGGDLDRARRLQESCHKLWLYYGIEPERLDYSDMSLVSPGYYLRPENIESNYYLYRLTGDDLYLNRAVTYLETLRFNCRVESGYASLKSVVTKEKEDEMPSYFLAETLKYLYLTFAPSSVLDLRRVVFTTEAHPLRRGAGRKG
jgi:mannosidase alpha-like ER degradation enhancer 2